MRTATHEAQQTYQGLQRRWAELDSQLAGVAGQQKRSPEAILSLKSSVKQLGHDCNTLTGNLTRAQALPNSNETESIRTFLSFASDVQVPFPEVPMSVAPSLVPRLMLGTAISQPRKWRVVESARSDVDPPTTRREQTPVASPGKRRVVEPDAFLLDDDVLDDWELRRSLNSPPRIRQPLCALEESDSSSGEFPLVKKRQREMDDGIPRLKVIQGVPRRKTVPVDDDSDDQRLGLMEARYKIPAGPGWLGTVVPQLGQRLRCSTVSQGGFQTLARAQPDPFDMGTAPAEPQLSVRTRLILHPDF
jgi:hypothetical protein